MENAIAVSLIALLFLTVMEIVLGIDNIVFIAIVTGRLPKDQQPNARRVGLGLALVMRILLLLTLSWILGLTKPLFELSSLGIFTDWLSQHEQEHINEVSWRDIILVGGGLFLVGKSVHEVHKQTEPAEEDHHGAESFIGVLIQIAILDVVFSLDSVITAVGMAKELWVMITAIIIAIGVMMVFAEKVSNFVQQYPTVKMLALSFLILIGVMLIAEGVGTALDKGYIYFAMAFALVVEMLNLRVRTFSRAVAKS